MGVKQKIAEFPQVMRKTKFRYSQQGGMGAFFVFFTFVLDYFSTTELLETLLSRFFMYLTLSQNQLVETD